MASLVMDVDMCEGERAGLVEEEQVSQEVDEKDQGLLFEGQVAGGDAAEDRQVSHEVDDKDQGLPFEGQVATQAGAEDKQVSHEVEEKDQGLPHEGQVVAEEKQVSHEVEEKDQGLPHVGGCQEISDQSPVPENSPTQHYEPADEDSFAFLTRAEQHKQANEALQEARQKPGKGRGRGRGRGKQLSDAEPKKRPAAQAQGESGKGPAKKQRGRKKKNEGESEGETQTTQPAQASQPAKPVPSRAQTEKAQPKGRVCKRPAARSVPARAQRPNVEQIYKHTMFDVYWSRPAVGLKIRATGRQARQQHNHACKALPLLLVRSSTLECVVLPFRPC